MGTGYVDEGWAREHHALWYEDIKAGKIPASAAPARRRRAQPRTPRHRNPTRKHMRTS